MKRLLLAVLLGIVAVVIAPVASASAAEVVTCNLKGKAKFTKPLKVVPQLGDKYSFTTDGTAANKCSDGGEVATASVEGTGPLACSVSLGLGVEGLVATFEKGSLKTSKTGVETFKLQAFEFVGVGPAVPFAAEGASTTTTDSFAGGGVALFSNTVTNLEECAGSGLPEVEFTATAAGVVSKL